MAFNLDIALDEVRRLPVAGEFLEFLVKKTHEFFGVEETPDEPAATAELATSSVPRPRRSNRQGNPKGKLDKEKIRARTN